MKLRIHFQTNGIIWMLLVFLVCSFTIFETYAWGRFVVLASLLAIMGILFVRERLRAHVAIGPFVLTVAILAAYSLVSALWALTPSEAVAKCKTLVEIAVMLFVFYNACRKTNDPAGFALSVIKWASYIIVLYSLLFYGLDTLIWMARMDKRLENAYTNVNTIGMLASIGTIIQADEMLREKRLKWAALFCVPSVFMLAVTQSRKAFVVLFLGVVADVFLHNMNSKDFRKRALRLILLGTVLLVSMHFLLSLPIFSGVMLRMERLFAGFLGGQADNSTTERNRMVMAGLEAFIRNPLFGVGMGNSNHITLQALGMNTYLHNNYVELLASGGIFAFLLYYSMHIYLLLAFWEYRKSKNTIYWLCLLLTLLFLIMDYGMVAYTSKLRYIYLLPMFLQVETLSKASQNRRRKRREK